MDWELKGGNTPTLGASLLVFIVMIGLILLSVFLFGEEVTKGPLQVSMTLATLFALAVAARYGFHDAIISQAVSRGVNAALGTIYILLAIGAIIGVLYLAGTVAAFVYYGVALVSPRFYYLIVFVLASLLSSLTGSVFTTAGAVGVAFVGLASLVGVSPAAAAGAAVAGALFGDKISKISDTVVLAVSVVGGVSLDEHRKTVMYTAIPAWILSALIFLALGLTGDPQGISADPAVVQETIGEIFNISLLAFIPVIVIFVLSTLRLSGFITLMVASISGVILAALTQPALITGVAADPSLTYIEAVMKVSIETLATGFHLNSGIPEMDSLFSGGGTFAMFETIWLILVAASFGAVAERSGMIQRIMEPVIAWATNSAKLILATMLTTTGLNIFTADPHVSIVLVARMYREGYIRQRLKPVVLSTMIADSGSVVSPLIPWNTAGAFIAGALGVRVLEFAPYAFFCYLTPIITLILGYIHFRKETLPMNLEPEAVYGEEPTSVPAPQQSA